MPKKRPPSVDDLLLSASASKVWARALRLHGAVANDNGQRQRRRTDTTSEGAILHLAVAPPKAG